MKKKLKELVIFAFIFCLFTVNVNISACDDCELDESLNHLLDDEELNYEESQLMQYVFDENSELLQTRGQVECYCGRYYPKYSEIFLHDVTWTDVCNNHPEVNCYYEYTDTMYECRTTCMNCGYYTSYNRIDRTQRHVLILE